MTDGIQINDAFTVGKKHPAEADLKELEQEGFQTVINLRAAGEDQQLQSPEEGGPDGARPRHDLPALSGEE